MSNEYTNSKLVDVVTVADVDSKNVLRTARLVKILKLKFGQDSRVNFWSKHLRLRFGQDYYAAVFQSFESGVLF